MKVNICFKSAAIFFWGWIGYYLYILLNKYSEVETQTECELGELPLIEEPQQVFETTPSRIYSPGELPFKQRKIFIQSHVTIEKFLFLF